MDNKILVNEEHDNISAEVEKQLDAAEEAVSEAMELAKEANQPQESKEGNATEVLADDGSVVEVSVQTSTEEENVSFFKSAKWKKIWDKITTGILIAVMAVPVAILTYILLWFLLK